MPECLKHLSSCVKCAERLVTWLCVTDDCIMETTRKSLSCVFFRCFSEYFRVFWVFGVIRDGDWRWMWVVEGSILGLDLQRFEINDEILWWIDFWIREFGEFWAALLIFDLSRGWILCLMVELLRLENIWGNVMKFTFLMGKFINMIYLLSLWPLASN